ncbi:MAG: SH3 domain-containing protein [Anaerolineae bacterium]|jgi:hypothetical protein|nr:SH3 domain-containing protein [Anaerolineae bacterium]
MRENPNLTPPRPIRPPGLFPPLWSIIITMVIVFGLVFAFALLIYALGGRTAPSPSPEIIIKTPLPLSELETGATILSTGTLPPEIVSPNLGMPATFVMAGPTLPPPNITPTPRTVAIGTIVRVVDVGDQQLNVRDRPGVLETSIVFRVPEGELFTVIEGPTQTDGLTWWRIQAIDNAGRTGWAAANYLQVIDSSSESE